MRERDQRLIDAYLDGHLNTEQGEALQELLRRNPEARAALRKRATIDEHLGDLAQDHRNETEAEARVVALPRWNVFIPWGIAAVLALVLFGDFFGAGRDAERAEGFVGLLVNEAGAHFEEGYGPQDVKFDEGEYRLSEGAIHLRLDNGTDLVMKSPARFRIDDSFHMALESGGLRAIVPPSAEGFTVATPGVDYEDLGTEFGVSVNAQNGTSQLHVYDGQVDAKRANSSQVLSSVFGGETVAYQEGEIQPTDLPDQGAFLQPGEIGLLRWEEWRSDFLSETGMIAYFPFEQNQDVSSKLRNHALNTVVSDGVIDQARWVSGRWPGKQALLFDSDSDYVEFDIPGEFDELTISAWIKVNRLDHELTAIINSNAWEGGGFHFQINRTGTVFSGIKGLVQNRDEERILNMNTWQHVVSVSSRVEERTSIYINGKLATRGAILKDGPIIPGTCRIGNWLKDVDWPKAPVRALKGRMDELAIWDRVLSENEIQAHYEAGRPNLLDD